MDTSSSPFIILSLETRALHDIIHEAVLRAKSSTDPIRIFLVTAVSMAYAQQERIHKRSIQLAEYSLATGKIVEVSSKLLGKRFQCVSAKKNVPSAHQIPVFFTCIFDEIEAHHDTWSMMVLAQRSPWQKESDEEKIQAILQKKWPKMSQIHIQWCSESSPISETALETVELYRPTLLVVSHKSPYQETFIASNWHRLKRAGIRIVIAGGEKTIFHIAHKLGSPHSFEKSYMTRLTHSIFSKNIMAVVEECHSSIKLIFRTLWYRFFSLTPK